MTDGRRMYLAMSEHEVVMMVAILVLVAVVAERIVRREMMVIMYRV